MQYKSSPFTNNSIVICKIIVGAGAHDSPSYDDGNVIAGRRGRRPLQMRKGDRNMKATGIVRRVDDLGRIVIPKEIRRTLRIREGEPSRTTFISSDLFIRGILAFEDRILGKTS